MHGRKYLKIPMFGIYKKCYDITEHDEDKKFHKDTYKSLLQKCFHAKVKKIANKFKQKNTGRYAKRCWILPFEISFKSWKRRSVKNWESCS